MRRTKRTARITWREVAAALGMLLVMYVFICCMFSM